MKKEERIAKYGKEAYAKRLEQRRAYYKEHREQEKAAVNAWQKKHPELRKAAKKKYREAHPEEVKANNQEGSRKGGKYYDKHLKDNRTGLRGTRNRIRGKHQYKYNQYKAIIAPDSQLHHEWVPKTSNYRGVALVEANAHQYGFVDVIEILDGAITLLTEEEVKRG